MSGLKTSVYTPVVGRVFWLKAALDPLQELDVASVVPSDFTIDSDKVEAIRGKRAVRHTSRHDLPRRAAEGQARILSRAS